MIGVTVKVIRKEGKLNLDRIIQHLSAPKRTGRAGSKVEPNPECAPGEFEQPTAGVIGVVDIGLFNKRLATRALYNEFGTVKSPPRPFFIRTMYIHRNEYIQLMTAHAREAYAGRRRGLRQQLRELGEQFKHDLVESIDSAQTWARPLADYTVLKKGHSLPLIETGEMRGAIEVKT